MTGLEIRVLGPLEVRVDGRPLLVDTRKAFAIVALLAVERRAYSRDELAALLWPESDDVSARGALRRTLSVLRAALRGRWLEAGRALVSLDPTGIWLDLAELELAARAETLTALRSASDVARGPFLAGFSLRDSPDFDDWRASRAAAAERARSTVLDRLADLAEASGDHAMAVTAASRRLEIDPLDESSHRRLMALLARAGDRTAAIRQYRSCVATLDRELGVPPIAETTALYEAIRDGSSDPLLVPRVTAPAMPTPAGARPPSRLPLIGRDAELAAVRAAHGSATRDGRLVLVAGEAGSGKSRLIEAATAAVRSEGGRVLIGRAYESERGVAYGLIISLLRAGLAAEQAIDRMRGLPPPTTREIERLIVLPAGISRAGRPGTAREASSGQAAARARLLDAIAEALSALAGGPMPGMVVAEDLHWADDASLEALAWLARRLANRPLVLACTWRPEDLDNPRALAAIVGAAPDATTVSVGRLDLEAVRAFARAASHEGREPADVQRLFEETEGLPLYLVEALAAPGDDASPGPLGRGQALLRDRINRVGDRAAQVMSAASVIGRSFTIAEVRGTSGRSEEDVIEALEELVRRGIVREDATGHVGAFDFAHSRLREAAYQTTSLARRRLLHQRAAAVLRSDHGDRGAGQLARIAEHERAAGNDLAAAEAFRDAGAHARALYALREAKNHFETALALGHPDVAGIQVELAEIRTSQGDYRAAIAALEATAALAAEADVPAIEVRLGRVHARRGDERAAASYLDAAIEALDRGSPSLDRTWLIRALLERAAVGAHSGDLDLAGRAARRALDLGRAASDDAAVGAAQRVLGIVARDRGDLDAARAFLRQSLDLAVSDPDSGTAVAVRNSLALVERARGDHAAAIDLLEIALEACRRTGERHLEAAVENNLADELHLAAREEEAIDHLKRAVAAFADVGGDGLEPEIWKLVEW